MATPSPRDVVRLQAAGRIVLGAALAVVPARATAAWLGGDSSKRPATAVLATMMGARDVGLGAGAAQALASGAPVRPWLVAGAFADLADFGAVLRARDGIPTAGLVMVGAIASVSAGLAIWAARELN